MKRNTYSNCIALYRHEKKVDFRLWFDFIKKIFNEFDQIVNYVGVIGQGYSDKLVPTKRIEKKLFESDFQGVGALTLIVSPDNSNSPTYEWFGFASINTSNDDVEVLICVDESTINFSSTEFEQFIKEICAREKFYYGYCYQREYAKGPEYYAMGIAQGVERNSDESKEIANWSRDRRNKNRIRAGFIRDVYQYNFISQGTTSITVGDSSFDKLIKENSAMGTLDFLNNDLYLWKVEEKNIKAIKGLLRPILLAKLEI